MTALYKRTFGNTVNLKPAKVSSQPHLASTIFTLVEEEAREMVASNIDAILNQLGWQDGFRIPVANEENKRLEEEIELKSKRRDELSERLASLASRLEAGRRHARHLDVERDANQRLISCHETELEAEERRGRLATSAVSSLRREARDHERERSTIVERIATIEREVRAVERTIETSKRTVELDQDVLARLRDELGRKEEDNQIIERYLKDDAREFQRLELQRQKLTAELENHREAVIRAVDEIRELEIVLDRTSRMHDDAMKERSQMIAQWTQSVAALKQRDDSIQKALRGIEILREIGKDKLAVLEEKEKFLEDQVRDNKELEESIRQSERKLAAMKNEEREISDAIGTYAIEVQTQRKSMEELTRRTRQTRADAKRKKIDVESKRTKIEEWKKRVDELTITAKEIDEQETNIADKTRQLERLIEQEEKRKSDAMKDVKRIQALILRASSRVAELESERKVWEMQAYNERKKFEQLTAACEKEEKSLNEKEELLYRVEYTMQKCEMRLEKLKGQERNSAEVERRQKIVEELQSVYAEKLEVSKLLQTQIASLEHEMKKISASLANDSNELERLRSKTQDLLLSMEGGEKRLKSAQLRSEERQVEENLLRLRVSQMRKMMLNVGRKVYNLEKFRLELDAALRERNAEIEAQKETLTVQRRVISGECSELRGAIAERRCRIRQLQARYDGSIAAFATNPDGTPIDTTYLKIKNAQEKFLLREQGDELDVAIRKTEHEIRSMENTLRVVNACNDKYKTSVGAVSQDGPEVAERAAVEEEFQAARRAVRRRRADLQRIKEDLQKMDESYGQLLLDTDRAKEEKEEKSRILANLEKQVQDQKEKLARAEKSLRKAYKDVQTMCACTPDKVILMQEKDIALRELQEQNTMALQDIAEFTIRHLEVEAYIKKLLSAKNIELPVAPSPGHSTATSRCGSSASSRECLSRRGVARRAASTSSKESASSIVNFEPQFRSKPSLRSSKNNEKINNRPARSTSKAGHS